jgi:hypothetical protein
MISSETRACTCRPTLQWLPWARGCCGRAGLGAWTAPLPFSSPCFRLYNCETWCGCRFNGGSALKAGGVAVSAVVSTQIGACCSGFVWLVLTWWLEKPSAVAVMNGAVAGLAGITPASGYINSPVRSCFFSLLLGQYCDCFRPLLSPHICFYFVNVCMCQFRRRLCWGSYWA